MVTRFHALGSYDEKTARILREKIVGISSEYRYSDDIPTKQVVGNNSSEFLLSSEIPRNFPTEFRGNKFPRKFRGPFVCRKCPRNIPRENIVGIFPRTFIDRCVLDIYTSIDRNIPTEIFLGIFRGTCPSVYSEELVPRNIPREQFLGNYAGVMSGEPSSKPYLGSAVTFLDSYGTFWLKKTSVQKGNATSACSKGSCSRTDQVCIKAESRKEGTCVVSTTRYVPAYSTRLKYNDGAWTILPQNTSDSIGMVDPIWTERNRNSIGVQVYTVQHSAYDNAVLVAGITVTTLAYIGIMVAKSYVPAYSTRLKYADGAWTILPQNTSDSMGMVDPIWAERNWNTIGVQVYTVQYSAYDNAVLVAGITVTTLAYIGIMVAKSFITKALKQD
ncbi:hypothetical protein F2Q70_00026960 [Brassica cretica]|uniref:Uncharacterized protein n=4 Tax=Brassica TaxID=3705 RepID=A0A8S9L7Z3_BRACR|nr:hypothetical protein F2Q70_00026960 [Brassica cretica]